MKTKILICAMALLMLCGCKTRVSNYNPDAENVRFYVEYSQTNVGGSIMIIRDTETDKKYMYVHSGYSGGLTELQE